MARSTTAELQKKHRRGGTHSKPDHRIRVSWFARRLGAAHVFLLHGLTACLSEIPRRFFSSLPPEFASGRCAAIFIPAPAAP
jgi:hypothetical protein